MERRKWRASLSGSQKETGDWRQETVRGQMTGDGRRQSSRQVQELGNRN